MDAVEEMITSTKLTDVNDDCLERVFKYLSLEDLLNVAETSKQLKTAVDRAFIFLFKDIDFRIDFVVYSFDMTDYVHISKIRDAFRSLRLFGNLISNLSLGLCKYDIYKYVFPYVSTYCTDSLRKIEIDGVENDFTIYLKRPLLNVETLYFRRCPTLNANGLRKYFPNAVWATFYLCKLISPEGVHFPHLQKVYSENVENISTLLEANVQLRDLRLQKCEMRNGWTFLERLENVEILIMYDILSSDLNIDGMIHLKNLRKLDIKFNSNVESFYKWNYIHKTLKCDQLEELQIFTHSMINFNLTEFIVQYPTIKSLELLMPSGTFSDENLMTIAHGLPLLEKMCFHGYTLTVGQIIRFMNECKNLKYICCISVHSEHLNAVDMELEVNSTHKWIRDWMPWYMFLIFLPESILEERHISAQFSNLCYLRFHR